jgi:hypothetical protein
VNEDLRLLKRGNRRRLRLRRLIVGRGAGLAKLVFAELRIEGAHRWHPT